MKLMKDKTSTSWIWWSTKDMTSTSWIWWSTMDKTSTSWMWWSTWTKVARTRTTIFKLLGPCESLSRSKTDVLTHNDWLNWFWTFLTSWFSRAKVVVSLMEFFRSSICSAFVSAKSFIADFTALFTRSAFVSTTSFKADFTALVTRSFTVFFYEKMNYFFLE